jgi:hypothetical protein
MTYILVLKKLKESYTSSSKKALSKESGVNYHTLNYYTRLKYYESDDVVFSIAKKLPSKQGGIKHKKDDTLKF